MHTLINRYAQDTLGLPSDGKFIAISNSDAGNLVCDRRFMFAQVDFLKGKGTRAMDLGTAWDIMMQDVFSWWQYKDSPYPTSGFDHCPHCNGTGLVHEITFGGCGEKVAPSKCSMCGGLGDSAIHRAMELFAQQLEGSYGEDPSLSELDFDKTKETLIRILEGYLHRWQGGPLQSIKILGTQIGLARAIVHPTTGKPYRPSMYLEKRTDVEGAPWQLAGVGAVVREQQGMVTLKRVSWPWLQVGLLDVLGADRQTDAAWVIDVKLSGQPSRYENGMEVDPQLPGYCWLLQPHLQHFGLKGIAGFMYDVAHSKFQPDPERLKWHPPNMETLKAEAAAKNIVVKGRSSQDYLTALGIEPGLGDFSRAQNAAVPSWRYEKALERANMDAAPYAAHIEWLADNVDRGLYDRPWQRFGPDHWERYSCEIYAKAAKMALLRKGGAKVQTITDLHTLFPRTPVCTVPGGSCPFRGACAQDGPESRSPFIVSPTQTWSDTPPPAKPVGAHETNTEEELDW